jgi:hypothetical protein
MLLIGLGHKAKNGKDTVADAIKAAYGMHLDIRLMSFADPLRQEVREAAKALFEIVHPGSPYDAQVGLYLLCGHYNLPFEENAPVDKDYPDGKQRVLHQFWGTDLRRAQDPEYWTKKAIERIQAYKADGADAVVLRDMRFKNEGAVVKELGGWTWKVSRLQWVSDVPQHISETELDDYPFDLHTGVRDGELELLKDMACDVFKRLWYRSSLRKNSGYTLP